MDATSSIVTSNTTASAVNINIFGDAGTPSTLKVSNITTGNGGTISLDASPEAEAGVILIQPGSKLNVGSNGTVVLKAAITSGSADAIGTATDKLDVIAGSVTFTSTEGNVHIVGQSATSFTGTNIGAAGVTNLSTVGGPLTVAGTLASDGGAINLTSAAGVAVAGTLGDANSGALNINGDLSGTGTIVTGSGDVTITQTAASTFSGSVNGSKNLIKLGAGDLTLAGTNSISGAVTVTSGILTINGSVNAASSITIAAGSILSGTGSVTAPATVSGTVNPGTTAIGTLTTGNIGFTTGGSLDINLQTNGDTLAVVGTANVMGAKLNVLPAAPISVGSKFTVLDNDGSDSITGFFTNAPTEGATVTAAGQDFSVSYVGGDGNDIVLTRVANATPNVTNFTVNNGSAQRSRITTITVNFDAAVTAANFNSLGAITLTRTQLSNPATGVLGDLVQTGPAAANHITVTQGSATSLVLTFDNNGSFTNESVGVENGSLSDGYWQLTIGGFQSTLNDLALRRLFGDSTATVAGVVDGADFLDFGNFFSSNDPRYDFDNDGTVSGSDLLIFGNRFGRAL
jgi:autotransporter-associated beta strand protein